MINEVITVDAGQAIGELDALAGAAEGAAAKIDAAFKSIKTPSLGGSGAGNMARSMEAAAAKMEASVGKMEASFAKLGETSKAASASLGDAGKVARDSAAGLGDAAKGANDAAASYARLGKAARDSSVMLDEQAVAGKRAAKSSAEGAAASEGFFSRHKELILGTGLALGYAVDKAMKFNASMTLLTTQAGVSAKQMPQLTKGVLELAGQVGQSPGNLAESLYHVESNMSSLGITAPKALHMVKVAAEGASVGHASLVDTTNALTAAVASGIPGVKSYDQAMGVLNATVGAGDMSMQDLADAMGTGALAAVKGYGANIKDAGAALATFGDNNIRGATAGTDLRMAVQSLAVQSPSATKELKALGLSAGELGKNMQAHGMLSALDLLSAKFKEHGINAKNMGTEITDLFGKKAGVGLAILMEQMGRLQSKYPDLTKGANDFGKAWDKTLQSPQQKLNNLIQGTQALAITAGNVLMPYANKALGGIDAGLGWLQSHAMASKGLALGAGALVVGGIGKGLFSGVESSLSGLGKIGSALKIPGLDKLAGLGKGAGLAGAAGSLDGAGASLKGAAASLEGAAGSLKGAAAVSGESGALGAGGKAGKGAAAAEGAAAGEAAGIGARGIATTGAIGALAALTVVDPLLRSMKSGPGGKNWFENPFGMAGPHDKGSSGNWLTSFSPYERLFRQTRAPATPGGIPSGSAPSAYSRFGPSAGGAPVPGPPARYANGRPFYGEVPQSRPAPFYGEVPQPGGAASQRIPQLSLGAHPAAAPTVQVKVKADTSALAGDIGAAKGKLQALSQVTIKAPKMPAPDMAALDGAKGKAASAGSGITSAIQGAMHPAKMPPPNLSAAASAAGAAQGIGASISAGLAAGIRSGIGAIQAAAAAAAAAASVAMARTAQTHSPSKVTEKTGKDIAQGLVVGLEGGTAAVKAASTALGNAATRPPDITSIDNTIAKLKKQVAGKPAMVMWLEGEQSDLEKLAAKRARLETEIASSEQAAKSAISGASIMNSLNAVNPAGNAPISSSAIVQGQQYQATSMQQFAKSLLQLQKQGLNATSLSQIAQAGPDQGLGMAQGIASGGKQAISQLNQLQKQMKGYAAQIGDVTGVAMYQSGQDIGKGLAAGLKAALKVTEKDIDKEARRVASIIGKVSDGAKAKARKTAAGSSAAGSSPASSPGAAAGSVVTAAGGKSLAAAASGLSAAGSSLSAAASALSSAASSLKGAGGGGGAGHVRVPAGGHAIAHPGVSSGGGYGGGAAYLPSFGAGGQHIHYHQAPVAVHVAGSVTAERDLLNTLQDAQLNRSSNNWQSGWQLPGHPN